ncbi:MAG: carboxypeptidase-like regulatory domain-containing protein [Bacteroidales bacterium]|nr:carboxypeptidase-like regulatory domain-containing protein [Bacteroidales bacterium]
MKRIVPIILMLLFTGLAALAQERTITGTITGADDGQTLPGVTVLVKGTRTGTASDVNGKYKITVPGKSAVLVFSFVGYSKLKSPWVRTSWWMPCLARKPNDSMNCGNRAGCEAREKGDRLFFRKNQYR